MIPPHGCLRDLAVHPGNDHFTPERTRFGAFLDWMQLEWSQEDDYRICVRWGPPSCPSPAGRRRKAEDE